MSSERPNANHIVVVGLMGVGKSTLGRVLARELGFAYADSDDDIMGVVGTTGGVVAEELGVPALHELEAAMLLGALARPKPTVITAAASVVENELVRRATANRAAVIWVKAEIDELLRRQRDGGHRRPMDREELVELEARRRALFHFMADIEVTADRETAVLVDEVVSALRSRQLLEDSHA